MTLLTSSTAVLSWSAAYDDVTHYYIEVYMTPVDGNDALILKMELPGERTTLSLNGNRCKFCSLIPCDTVDLSESDSISREKTQKPSLKLKT